MSKISKLNALAASVVMGALSAGSAQAAANPFMATPVPSSNLQLAHEGGCGGSHSGEKAAEGACAGSKKSDAKSDHEAATKPDPAAKSEQEGKCGEGKCGADMMKKKEPTKEPVKE